MMAPLKALFVLGALAAVPSMRASTALGAAGPITADHAISAKRFIGTTVYDDHNQAWGVIQDVIVPPSGEPMAVVSVSKMVGHAKLVAVPLSRMKVANGRTTMAGASKETAEKLPDYSYTSVSGAG
jgi:hypothetical protein